MTTIIDFHTHVFPDDLAPKAIAKLIADAPDGKNYTDGTINGLLHSMRNNRITRSVTMPIATRKEQVSTINSFQKSTNIPPIIAFGALHPAKENVEETVTALVRDNIRGVKLHPEYQNFYMDDPICFPLYEAMSNAGLILLFHAGKDPGPFTCDHALPSAFLTIRNNFPNLIMVAAHMGGWKLWRESFDNLCGKSLYFDTSAIYGLIDKDLFLQMVKKHGTERILFGSDSPWIDQGVAWRWIDGLPFSDREKENIFSRNALSLLGSDFT